jgi:general secretion pathway protein K
MTILTRAVRGCEAVAIVVVLWVIMVLSLLISGFAFTMHVEMQVASFSRKELKAEMLARSGIEVARMQLLLHDKKPTEAGFDALTQEWATNEELYVDHELGEGKYNVKVTDEESKLPVNRLSQAQWKHLMHVLEIDPLDSDVIVDSIIDWIDEDDLHQLNGAESDYYESLSPPYKAKNGPVDRVEELLLVRGVTKEIFDGIPAAEDSPGRPGLKDLLTTTSAGVVNVNTASQTVLQAFLGLDDVQVAVVLSRRDGQDGIAGTDDDVPFRSVDEFFSVAGGGNTPAMQQARPMISVSSATFRVQSTGEVGGVKRTIIAVLRRQGGDCMIVTWNEVRGGV